MFARRGRLNRRGVGQSRSSGASAPAAQATALYLDGKNDHYTTPDAEEFKLTTWTIDCWIYLDSYGVIGSGGGSTGYPIFAKGSGTSQVNYWFGIDTNLKVRGGFHLADNTARAMTGTNAIERRVWTHIAWTYDGTSHRTYINGALDRTLAAAGPPVSSSTAPVTIGTGKTPAGSATGRLHAQTRNLRLRSTVLDSSGVQTSANTQGSMVGEVGLVAEWLFNDGSGVPSGTHALTAQENPNWLPDECPFQLDRPGSVSWVGPADFSSHASSVSLQYSIADADSNANDIEVWVRQQVSEPAFIIPVQPDAQFLSEDWNAELLAQANDWAARLAGWRAPFGLGVGDCVNVSNTTQWDAYETNWLSVLRAAGFLFKLEMGNHDQDENGDPLGSVLYDQYAAAHYAAQPGLTLHRFTGYDAQLEREYWGHLAMEATTLDGRLTFLIIGFAYDTETVTDPAPIEWARQLVEANPDKLVIIVSHYLCEINWPGDFTQQGQLIYDAVKDYRNVFLMLNGHLQEGQRVDYRYLSGVGWKPLYTLQQDYQHLQAGTQRDKYRTLEVDQRYGVVRVKTFDPGVDTYELDSDSDFTIPVDFCDTEWTLHDTISGVAAGGSGTYVLTLPAGDYEVLLKAKNGNVTRESERRSFTIT